MRRRPSPPRSVPARFSWEQQDEFGGRRSTSHYLVARELVRFGAVPTAQRVVEELDARIITAAGVSSGIDMGLRLVELLTDRTTAEAVQLWMEYDPQPPFDSGHPYPRHPRGDRPSGGVRQRGQSGTLTCRSAPLLDADPLLRDAQAIEGHQFGAVDPAAVGHRVAGDVDDLVLVRQQVRPGADVGAGQRGDAGPVPAGGRRASGSRAAQAS